jgi:tetratricopeptide (TPR) repeat protein
LLGTVSCTFTRDAAKRRYLKKGDTLYADGKYAEANINYRKAIQTDQNFGEAYYGLALSQLQQGTVRDAYQNVAQAAQLLPGREDVKVKLADVCLLLYLPDPQRGESFYKQLTEISDALLARNPNSYDGLRFKGYLAAMDKKVPESVGFFRQANALKPMQPEVVLALTQGLLLLKLNDEADKVAWALIQSGTSFGQIYDVLYASYLSNNRMADAERVLRTKAANNPKTGRYITQLAAHYYAFGKQAEMNSTLQRLKDHPNDFPDGHLLVGDFYIAIHKPDEARREFEEGAKANPQEAAVYEKRITNLLVAQGKNAEAMQVVDKLVAANPKDVSPKSVKAGLLLASGDAERIDLAVKYLEEIVKTQPDDPIAHYNLGRALWAQGNLPMARGQFEESIKKRPNFLPPRYHLAEIDIASRQFAPAFRYANEILTLQPNDPKARLLLASSQQGSGQLKDARKTLDALIQSRPGYIDAQLQLGFLDMQEGKLKDAGNIFEGLYKQGGGKDVRILEALVEFLLATGQPDKALAILGDELKKSPDSVVLRSQLASTAARLKKFDLAIEQYQQLEAKNPTVADYPLYLGEAYARKDDLGRAVASLQKAQQLAPKSPLVAGHLASMLERAGRKDEAIAAYRELLRLQPENPEVWNNLAYLMAESGKNLDEAMNLAEAAKRKMPNEPLISDTIGWIYLKRGTLQSAMQVFGTLTRQVPTNPTYHYHYGLSLLKNGENKKAALELQTALANHPSKSEEAQIRQLIATTH